MLTRSTITPPEQYAEPSEGSSANFASALRQVASYMWRGPTSLPHTLQLEWRFIAIRWLGILFVGPALAVADMPHAARMAAFGVLAAALLYNSVLSVVLSRHPNWFANGFVTTSCDAALNIGLIMVAGGFNTPFYFILYTVTISAAMRYGYGPAFAVATTFVAFDLWEGLMFARDIDAAFIFRSGFLIMTAVLAGYLREQAEKAETDLQDRLRDAQALNEELESFSYSVSHDLRAPLRTVDGFSAIIIEDHGASLDPEVHEYLTRIRQSSQRMARLIDDLLDLSRVTRKDINYEKVNLSSLGREVLEELRTREPDRPVSTHITAGLLADGDPDLLRLVLENLLANAWKFTGKTEKPVVEIGMTQQEGKTVYFVRDNGAGFDSEKASKLFRIFQRLHKESDFEGTGIGLATVRRIIRRHGGDIWAKGAVGSGATFYFTLPSHRHSEPGVKDSQRNWYGPRLDRERVA